MALLLSGLLGSLSFLDMVHFVFLAFFIYSVCYAFHALYLHPLSHYPGPKLAAISPIPLIIWEIRGKQHSQVKALHDKYGEVIRISPNALVYRTSQVWKDIYGHRKKGQKSFPKDPQLYTPTPNGTEGVVTADEANHSRMRRLMSHAFSDRALREQETLLHAYADLLVQKLHEQVVEGPSSKVVDIVRWYNYVTFDLIGDLSFGEPFHCLRDDHYHWWVSLMLDAVKVSVYLKIPHFFPFLKPLGKVLIPKRLSERKDAVFQLTVDKVSRRLRRQTERPDFTSYILRHSHDGLGMTRDEIDANAATFVLAGSETTAALLSGCTYHLLRTPKVYRRLVDEIRSSFKAASNIQLSSIATLPYLNAVLEESMRIYPPVPAMLPRLVPEGGAMINGQYVPEGTSVSISLYSTFRSATNFAEPDSFIPERWLKPTNNEVKDKRFETDNKFALQPFSYGPRNCIGQHLAYAEMRLILTKLLWHFDMESSPECAGWVDQESYNLWDRPPLKVKLSLSAGQEYI